MLYLFFYKDTKNYDTKISIFSIYLQSLIVVMKKQTKPNICSKITFNRKHIPIYITATIIGIIVLFYVALYLSVPSFSFEEPHPFKGKFVYNPYQNISETNWQYYDFRNENAENTQLPVYEYGYGIFPTKYLCIDYQSKRIIDYPLFQNIHFKQHNINCLSKKCGLVILAHPSKGFKLREMKHLDNYKALEVFSPHGTHFDYWDMALSSGHRVNAIASNIYKSNEDFISKTVINQVDESNNSIVSSLKNGDSYIVSFRKNNPEIPELKSLIFKNDTMFVRASKRIEEIRFIGQNGILKYSLVDVDQGMYIFSNDDSYIRTEMRFDDGTTIYLNPLTRHEFQYFFDPSLSYMMKARTWLMRFVYIFATIFFIKYLLSNKKEDNDC